MKETTLPVILRLWASVGALAICWFMGSIAFGVYLRDGGATLAFFFWSVPFFIAGWVLVGLPMIAMGDRVLKVPILLMGIAGAIAGTLVVLLPFVLTALILNGSIHLQEDWNSEKSALPAFGAGIGACAMMLFRWFLGLGASRPTPSVESL